MHDARCLELLDIGIGNDASAEHDDVCCVKGFELIDNAWEQRQVSTGQSGQTHPVDILFDRNRCDLGRGLVKTRIDDLTSSVAQGTSDNLGAAIMPIKTWFCDEYASRHRPEW